MLFRSGPTPKLSPPLPPSSQGPTGDMGPGFSPSLHGGASGYGTTGPSGASQHSGGDNPNALSSTTTTGATTNFPEEFDVHNNIPPEFEKEEGSDWFAIFFNPKVKRVLDVSLVHTLMHERYVCALVSR